MHRPLAVMGRDRSTGRLNGLKRSALRNQEENAVPAHVIGSDSVILVDAREPENPAVEGGSPVEIGDVRGFF
jgi:hypothetical protein